MFVYVRVIYILFRMHYVYLCVILLVIRQELPTDDARFGYYSRHNRSLSRWVLEHRTTARIGLHHQDIHPAGAASKDQPPPH